ncbi:hypothetical protein [Blastomonas sp.]|uniref:hypothetical protein n=1 Tax=Blastomonas sp. TaxID=1909299 RepID=UPI00391D37C6
MSGGDQGWQVGDLALCVADRGWWDCYNRPAKEPRPGSVHRVESIYGEAGFRFLRFKEFGDCGYVTSAFRKIDPHTRDAEDDETIALLNRAPMRTPEPVS